MTVVMSATKKPKAPKLFADELIDQLLAPVATIHVLRTVFHFSLGKPVASPAIPLAAVAMIVWFECLKRRMSVNAT